MSDAVRTIEHNGKTIEILHDSDPQNPRKDFEPFGRMICFHKRYRLGDQHDYRHENYSGWDEMEAAILKQEDVAVILPLYLYDHSGYTISTTPFTCPWDSGQIGFIFISKAKARQEMMVKRLTSKVLEQVRKNLVSEVKNYDDYLTGAVYGYVVKDANGEEVDSCWGFYGHDETKDGSDMIEQAKQAAA